MIISDAMKEKFQLQVDALCQKVESKEQERVAEWNAKREAYGQRDAANAACEAMRQKVERANYLIKLMAEDGWLYHGPEGMDETQQAVSDYYTEAKLGELTDKGIPVRAALAKETNESDEA